MADKTVTYRLTADISGFQAKIGQAAAATGKLAKDLTANTDEAAKARAGLDHFGSAAGKLALVAGAGLAGAAKAAVDWEQAWAGVAKTVDGAGPALEGSLRGLARELPATHAEIAGVAEAAGQLGVASGDVASFTKTMIDLGESTADLSAEEAAMSIKQIGAVTGLADSDVSRFASSLVALGNNSQTTEGKILAMAQRIAGAGAQVGLTNDEILAISAATASMGIEADLGGTAITRVFTDMSKAVAQGGDSLDKFAAVAGVSSGEFQRLFSDTPAEAFGAFTAGLDRIKESGGDVFTTLKEIGLTDVGVSQALLGMSSAGDLLTRSLDISSEAWRENTALAKEAQARYETAGSQMAIAWNNITDAGISAGDVLLPAVVGMSKGIAGLAGAVADLPPGVQTAMVALTGLAAVAGGGLWTGVKIIGGIAATREALENLGISADRVKSSLSGLRGSGLGLAGIGGMALGLGAVGIALAGATSLLGAWMQRQAEAEAKVAALTNEIDAQTGALTETGAALVANGIQDSGWVEYAREMGISLDTVTRAVTGNKDALAEIRGVLSGSAGEWKSYGGSVAYAANEADDMLAALARQGDEFDKASERSKLNEAALNAVGETMGGIGSAADGATPSLASVRSELEKAGFTAEELDAAAAGSTGGIGSMGDAAADAADPLRDLVTAMRNARSEALQASSAQVAYHASLDELTDAAARNGQTVIANGRVMDLYNEKGRANQTALDNMAASWNALDDAAKNTAGAHRNAVGTYVKAAVQMGYNKDVARDLARTYLEIPPNRTTKIETKGAGKAKRDAEDNTRAQNKVPGEKNTNYKTSGAGKAKGTAKDVERTIKKLPETMLIALGLTGAGKAKADVKGVGDAAKGVPKKAQTAVSAPGATKSKGEIDRLDGSVDKLKGKTIRVDETGATAARGRVDALRGSINSLSGKTVTVTTVHRTVRTGDGGKGLAGGGLVLGPGTATSDSIAAWLSRGEYVMPANIVAALGAGYFDQLRAGHLPRPLSLATHAQAPRFMTGGYVTAAAASAAAPPRVTVRPAHDAALLAAVEGLRAELRESPGRTGAAVGREINGWVDNAARSSGL